VCMYVCMYVYICVCVLHNTDFREECNYSFLLCKFKSERIVHNVLYWFITPFALVGGHQCFLKQCFRPPSGVKWVEVKVSFRPTLCRDLCEACGCVLYSDLEMNS
jgi:hypothetical protein